MRRRLVASLAGIAATAALLGIQPASAQEPAPVTVAIVEGIGNVCTAAKTAINGVPNNKCTYSTDVFGVPASEGELGLTWPGFGPPARGPFTFQAGRTLGPPASVCVSSVGGPGCQFTSWGILTPGDPSEIGAYCGSSKGTGQSTFSAGDGSLETEASFGWSQSAGTILPLQGEVTDTTPNGGEGAQVVGFVSSRGTDGGGNCGVTQITTGFNVEGIIITYQA